MENIRHERVHEFIQGYCLDVDSFEELFEETFDIKIKHLRRKMINLTPLFI